MSLLPEGYLIDLNDPLVPAPDRETEFNASYWFPLRPRLIEVTRVTRLSASLARVRFTGPDLADFATVAPEDHVKLFFSRDEHDRPVLPVVDNDRWQVDRELVFRDYTVRGFSRAELWLDIDFVLHDHGVAGRWAGTCAPGDTLAMLGPRGAFRVKDVFDQYVLAADDTALPALARFVENLRPGVPVHAFVEVQGEADRLDVVSQADLSVTWLHRGAAAPGTTDLLERAVRDLDWPTGSVYVWVAGEAQCIKPLRRYLARDRGLHRDAYDVDGYWRRGEANHDHHEDVDAPEAGHAD